MDRQIVESRALYARRAALTGEALERHMPEGTTWTTPQGGFYISGVRAGRRGHRGAVRGRPRPQGGLRAGRPFYPTDDGHTQLRLCYSRAQDDLIDEGIRRIGEVFKTALESR